MTLPDTIGVELVLLGGEEAARIASGSPGPEDQWAEGFPREDDTEGAAAATAGAGPFGAYKLVPRTHGRTIGTAGFFGPPGPSGEVTIGYGMIEPEWGRGYGTQAVAGLVQICRAHGGVTVINADTDLDNVSSQRVLEKNGFQEVRSSDTQRSYALRLASPDS